MATSELSNIEDIEKFKDAFWASTSTVDYHLTSDKQINLFHQLFEDAVSKCRRSERFLTPLNLLDFPREDSAITTDRVLSSPASLFLKLAEDWKKEGEPGYLLSRIEGSSEIRHGRKIAGRIRELRQILREDDSSDISPDSFRSFYEFLNLNPDVSYPGISVTPDGDIYARWKGADRELFSIHFLSGLRLRYVVFSPDRVRQCCTNRSSGIGFVETILEIVDRAYEVNKWVKE